MANTAGDLRANPVPRALLAGLFVTAGVAHFVSPAWFIAIVPPALPNPALLVALSGAAELAGGVGLLVAPVRRAAAVGLIALLVAVFPANIQMLRAHLAEGGGGWYEAALWLRLPLQPLLVWAVYRWGLRREEPREHQALR